MTAAVRIACLLIALAPLALAQDEEPKPPESAALPFIQSAQPKLQAQDWKGALADLDKAVAADSEFWRAYYLRAMVRQRLGNHKGAIADIDAIFDLEPPGDSAWQLYKVRGLSKQDEGTYAAAEEDYTKGIDLQSRDPDLFLRRAQVRSYQGNFKGAVEDYTSLSGLAPQFAGAYIGRGEAKARLGDFDSALEDLDAAVYLAETSSMPYTTRGRVRLMKGDRKGGLADFDRAVEVATDTPDALFGRGRARFDLGDFKGALEDLAESVKLDPKGQEYTALYRCLARRAVGKVPEARKEMKAYLDAREKKDDWYAKIARFLSGTLIEKDFLAAAANTNRQIASQHQCEAYWYAGAVRSIAGEPAKARELFKACVATKQYHFIEYESATWALKGKTE